MVQQIAEHHLIIKLVYSGDIRRLVYMKVYWYDQGQTKRKTCQNLDKLRERTVNIYEYFWPFITASLFFKHTHFYTHTIYLNFH